MPSLQNGQTHWNNLSAAAYNLKVWSLLPHPQSKTLIISFPKLHTRDKFTDITSNFDQCCKWSRDIKDEKKIFFQIVLVWFDCCFKMAIRRKFCYWACLQLEPWLVAWTLYLCLMTWVQLNTWHSSILSQDSCFSCHCAIVTPISLFLLVIVCPKNQRKALNQTLFAFRKGGKIKFFSIAL